MKLKNALLFFFFFLGTDLIPDQLADQHGGDGGAETS